MRVKIFYNMWGQDLEDAINKWLTEHEEDYDVVDIKLAAAGGGNSVDAFESWQAMIIYK